MIIFDWHLDLAWNALTFGRDYTRSALATRQAEANSETPRRNGNTLLGLPEYLQGQVAVIFGALFASPARSAAAWEVDSYSNADEAYRAASRQLDYYHRLTDEHEQFVRIAGRADPQRQNIFLRGLRRIAGGAANHSAREYSQPAISGGHAGQLARKHSGFDSLLPADVQSLE